MDQPPLKTRAWKRAVEVFEIALEVPADAREELIRAETGADTRVAAIVRGMLEADEAADEALDNGIVSFQDLAVSEHVERLQRALGEAYVIDRELGSGGMATVFLAQDRKHDRLVAIKVLHARIARSVGAERFLREVRTAARLNHPHILPLFDSGVSDGFFHYVMPYVEGESLRERLERLGQIHVEEAIGYVQELASALDYSHRQGVVHRDIKPENVMLHEGNAMLMDFGIAKALDDGPEGTLTGAGMFVGTPAYVSPEQAVGEADVDGRSDQFSLGCVLHEMICGEPPFKGSSARSLIAARFTRPVDLSPLGDRVGPELASALRKAMSLDPVERFATLGEFAASLSGGARSTPVAMRLLGPPVVAAAKSVAVLPFVNKSFDEESEFLADGIAEEIIGALTKVRSLRVASRSLSFSVRGMRENIPAVGRKLKVSTVLDGSLRRLGNRIRVTAELVNAADGSHLWSERYDRDIEDVFAIQDDIAESIVRSLRVILADEERKALKARTRDLRAYEYYLKGRQFVELRRKSLAHALDMFARAVAIDDTYAEAHAGIAECSALMCLMFEPSEERRVQAEVSSARALELDADIAESHHARAMAYSVRRDYASANTEFETAMRLDPKLFEVPYYWGRTLMWEGRPAEAVRLLLMAQSLRPEDYAPVATASQAYSLIGRRADAEAASTRARRLMEERLELNPDDARTWYLLSTLYASSGERTLAEAAAERSLAIDPDEPLPYYNVACTYALLGDADRAMSYLEGAVERGWTHKEWAEHDPDFDILRDTGRYKALIARI